KVQRRSPGRFVTVRKVRAILAQIISFGSEVVIDDVERYGEPARVRGIHEMLQIARSSVALLHRKRIHAVVTPISTSRELGDRHYLDSRYAQRSNIIQRCKQRTESSFPRKGPDV